MSRNLIICCDGTNNKFGLENTSVVRVVEVLNRDSARQLVFYDPGVGTLPEQRFSTRAGKKFSEIIGLAFGAGLLDNVQDAYEFLMQNWKPGDKVFVFGFSRGAYTARVLSALLLLFGLLPKGATNLLPYVMRQFKASRKLLGKSEESRDAYWKFSKAFRQTFAEAYPGIETREFPVDYLGIWDTVSSVGMVYSPDIFPNTANMPRVLAYRHAIAIDERRCFFRQNRAFAPKDTKTPEKFEQLWFPGVHSDVGGGYPEADGGLWREPFLWVLEGAKNAGMEVDPANERTVLNRTPPPAKPWAEPKHESLTLGWWPAEIFPKLPRDSKTRRRSIRIGLGRRRRLHTGDKFHPSVINRVRDDLAYNPPNLPESLLAAWRAGSNDDTFP